VETIEVAVIVLGAAGIIGGCLIQAARLAAREVAAGLVDAANQTAPVFHAGQGGEVRVIISDPNKRGLS
jgi:uncharacterized protein YbjT (DUF2867 family)